MDDKQLSSCRFVRLIGFWLAAAGFVIVDLHRLETSGDFVQRSLDSKTNRLISNVFKWIVGKPRTDKQVLRDRRVA